MEKTMVKDRNYVDPFRLGLTSVKQAVVDLAIPFVHLRGSARLSIQ